MLKVVAHLLSLKHFFLYAHFDARRYAPCFGASLKLGLKAGDVADMSQAERPCPETTGGVEDWFPNRISQKLLWRVRKDRSRS